MGYSSSTSYQSDTRLQDDVHGGRLNVARQRLHVDPLGRVQAEGASGRLQPAAGQRVTAGHSGISSTSWSRVH